MPDNRPNYPDATLTDASDDVGGVQYPRHKVALGADGVYQRDLAAGQATMANSLPVAVASDQSAVPVSGTVGVSNLPATQAVSSADGSLNTVGAQADAAWTGAGSGTVVSVLKAIWTRLRGGQATMAGSLPVAIASDQGAVPVSGTVTANAGTNLSTSALALDATLTGGTQKAVARGGAKGTTTAADVTSLAVDANTQALHTSVTNFPATQPVSAASLPLPTGAATAAKQAAVGTAGTPSADVLSVQGAASMTALKTDGSGVTQPVSPTQATTTATLGALNAAHTTVLNGYGTASFDVPSGLVGTVALEGTIDGTNWIAATGWSYTNTSQNTISSFTAFPHRGVFHSAGFQQVRLRVSAYTSGSTTSTMVTKPEENPAAPINDNNATPTLPGVYAFLLARNPNSGTWYRAGVVDGNGDTLGVFAQGLLVSNYALLYDSVGNQWVRARGSVANGAQVDVTRLAVNPTTLVVAANPAVNTGATLTLPAVAGQFHYVTRIRISRNATAALSGSAQLQITTTNLPGSLTFEVGNAMSAGGTQTDMDNDFGSYPLKSSVVNTATTFVLPAPGAAVRWSVQIFYYAGT